MAFRPLRELASQRERIGEGILLLGFLLTAYALCRLIPYSSGDDAFFSEMAHNMGLFEYIRMRYLTWEGRATSGALIWIVFRLGRGFWAVANAFMLTLLPLGLIRVVKRVNDFKSFTPEACACVADKQSLYLTLALLLGTLFLGMDVIGHGAFWITGSIVYLWCIVAGVWAAMPLLDFVYPFETRPPADAHDSLSKLVPCSDSESAQPPWKGFVYSIPCAVVAAMGQEQIAAVLLAFCSIVVAYSYKKTKRIPWLLSLQTIVIIVCLALSFLAPGNSLRSVAEIDRWLPQFSTMSTGLHLFITLQWLLSGFANQSKMLLIILWMLCAFLLVQKNDIRSRVLAALACLMAIVAMLPYVGITMLSDMGMGVISPAIPVWSVATPSSLGLWNWIAMTWWAIALVLTLVLLWNGQAPRSVNGTATYLPEPPSASLLSIFLFLASVASAATMYFSPTIYASGGRVFFVTQVLLWLLIGIFFVKLETKTQRRLLFVFLLAGLINFASGIPYLMNFLG